jgi:hypothetical protein
VLRQGLDLHGRCLTETTQVAPTHHTLLTVESIGHTPSTV